jgi:hypothetical protein
MMMTRLADSDCPSDWGWNAVIMWSLVPMSRISSCQNKEVKTVFRSDTMDWDISCRRTTSLKKAWATNCGVRMRQGNEVAILAQSVHHHEDHRFPADSR